MSARLDLNLSDKSSRDAFASEIVTFQVLPSLEAQGELPDRRQKNYSIQRNEPGSSGQQKIAPNYKPWHVPFTQPRVDIIAGSLYQRFTAIDPMVQCVPIGLTGLSQASEMERLVQAALSNADLDTQLPLGAQTAAVCGVTLFRYYPDDEKGMCLDVIHPDDFMVYPSTVRSVKDCTTCGHGFWQTVEQIEEKEESGEYLEGCSEGLTGRKVASEDLPGSPLIARAQPERGVVRPEDMGVRCWELVTRIDTGEKDEDGSEVGKAWYKVVVTESVPRLLEVKRLEYSRPWYFEGRLHVEWGGFWPEGSIAQNLQGMQHLYTDLHNALVAGSFSAMSPRVILSGGVLGEKMFTMGFGDVFQANGPINVSVIPSAFNPGVLPQMIQEVDAKGDAIARVSRISQNRQLKGRTTAHEAEMLYQQGEDSEVQYAAHFSRPIKEMAEFTQECARVHPDFFRHHYPQAPISPEALNGTYRMEVAGRTQSNLPQTVIDKLQQALGTATQVNQLKMAMHMNPVYDEEKIGDMIMNALELSVNVDALKYPAQDEPSGQQPPGQLAQPGVFGGMGADMGFPGMGDGAALPPGYAGAGGGGYPE